MFRSITKNTSLKFVNRTSPVLNSVRNMITSHAVMIKQHGEPSDVLFTQSYNIDDENLPSNSVIVKTLGSPINPSDINQIQGVYPSQPEKTTKFGTDFPSFICGNEGLFEIVKVGKDVTELSAGDWCLPSRVCSGTWRTYAEFTQDQLFKIPNPSQSEANGKTGLTVQQGSTLTVNPLSAYLMLTHYLNLENGKDWFIQNGGTSAVAQFATQMGKIMGIKSISVIRDRSNLEEVKQDLIENYGATKVITEEQSNSREFTGTFKSWIKESNGSLKLALNCVGGKSSAGIARKLDNDGLMLTYGGMSLQPVTFPTTLHIFKNITSAGFWCTRIVEQDVALKQSIVKKIVDWYEQGLLKDAASDFINHNGSNDLSDLFKQGISKSGKQLVVY